MSDLFAPRRAADDREAAAIVKRRIGVRAAADVAGTGRACPQCGAPGALAPSADDQTWVCRGAARTQEARGGCGASGDAIDLVRLARRLGFRAALKFLDEAPREPARDAVGDATAQERLL